MQETWLHDSLGTDSHISYDIGNFEQAERLLNNTNFPEKYNNKLINRKP